VRKVIAHFGEMADKEPESYAKFFQEFGRYLKEGYQLDSTTATGSLRCFAGIRRTARRQCPSRTTSNACRPSRKTSTISVAPIRAILLRSPHLEVFPEEWLRVLLLTDPLEDLIVTQMRDFEGKPLRAADQAGWIWPSRPRPSSRSPRVESFPR
jgi:molecular chaperone HtpG